MTIRAVVFDMDGLMFNSEDVYWMVGTELLRPRGHEYTRELADAMMGRPPKSAFFVMIDHCNLDATWQQLAKESEEAFLRLMPGRVLPMPGLFELLDALEKAGIPKAIGTSSQLVLAKAVLGQFNLEPRFQFVLTCEDIVHGKPEPEIYQKAAARLGIDPSEMLVLEDSQNGCTAAAAAGAFTVAVPGEHSDSQDFSMASLRIDSLADPRLYAAIGIEIQ